MCAAAKPTSMAIIIHGAEGIFLLVVLLGVVMGLA
jgi:hypothetical protein